MKIIVLLVILLFSFSMLSFADNARLDARRDAERFLGKAPEYVSAYVAAYEAKVKSLRRRSLLWGFGAGIGLLIVLNSMDVL